MEREEFEKIVAEEFEKIPDDWKRLIRNCALIVDDLPPEGDSVLGFYRGIPTTERGDFYGVGETMPDSITLYRLPILRAAGDWNQSVRDVVRETIWHEVAHHFGFSEEEVERREREATNKFKDKR